MARRAGRRGDEWITRRIRQGRGQGEGAAYDPWLYVQEVPSRGLSCRIWSHKTGRIHHLLSKLERSYFLILNWSPRVIDIREQYPLLPRLATVELATATGIAHSRHPHSREPIVMTTDVLATVLVPVPGGTEPRLMARSVKYAQDLTQPRVLEKLELEGLYWQMRRIDWGIVTEQDIPRDLADNLWFLHGYADIGARLDLDELELFEAASMLTDLVRQGSLALRHAARECDRRLGHERGTCLALAYHLIVTRQWSVDLYRPLRAREVLPLLDTSLIVPDGRRL